MRLLLCQIGAEGSLSRGLTAILRSSDQFTVELSREVVDGEALSDLDRLCGRLSEDPPDCVVLVFHRKYLREAGSLVEDFRVRGLVLPFFVATRDVEANELLELLRRGATDFITPPLEASNVLVRLWRSIAPHRDESAPSRRLHQRIGLKRLIGEDPEFTREIEKIPLVARCDVTVLICGESGTGKELVARAVHYLSPRSSKPFVPVSCGAIPVELAESELFGHREGAFTGASALHRGLIEEAQGGTVFLDDVECLPPLLQAKLLRFIQEKEFRVLGSSRLRRADVRIVTASSPD